MSMKVRHPCPCCDDQTGFDVEVDPDGGVVFLTPDHEPEDEDDEPVIFYLTREEWDRVQAYVAKMHKHDNCAHCAAEAES